MGGVCGYVLCFMYNLSQVLRQNVCFSLRGGRGGWCRCASGIQVVITSLFVCVECVGGCVCVGVCVCVCVHMCVCACVSASSHLNPHYLFVPDDLYSQSTS